MKKASAVFVLLLAVVVAVVYLKQRPKDHEAQGASVPRSDVTTNAPSSERLAIAPDTDTILTNAQHPEFAQRVLPVVREFFATLDRAGVNPIAGELAINTVQLKDMPNGLMARFLIGDRWSCMTFTGPTFSGVMHFGEREGLIIHSGRSATPTRTR